MFLESYIFFIPRFRYGSKWADLSISASDDKLCGKMRENSSRKTAVTTAIQKEVSMRMHNGRTGERERGGEEKREKDRIRLMSFAQTRREANVIYEDRATSRVGEVSRLKNL